MLDQSIEFLAVELGESLKRYLPSLLRVKFAHDDLDLIL